MFKNICIWLCLSIVPYWFYRLFYNFYIQQFFYRINRSDKFSPVKMHRYKNLYFTFMIMGFPLYFLFYPVSRKSYRLLYARYVSDVTSAYHIGSDPAIPYEKKEQKLIFSHLPVGHSAEPIDLPEWWFEC